MTETKADMKSQVEAMATKAGKAEKSDDALKFSQGALNTANAMRVLKDC